MAALGLMMAALALVPMPREVEWRDGTCTFAESDVRFARDALCEDYFAFNPELGHAEHSYRRACNQVELAAQMLCEREV